MDEAEALLNLQSRRSTRQSKPTKHSDFLYTDTDFLDERYLFLQHQSLFACVQLPLTHMTEYSPTKLGNLRGYSPVFKTEHVAKINI